MRHAAAGSHSARSAAASRVEVAGRIGGDAVQFGRAEGLERVRHGAEAGEPERIGVVGVRHGVEHEPLDGLRMRAA